MLIHSPQQNSNSGFLSKMIIGEKKLNLINKLIISEKKINLINKLIFANQLQCLKSNKCHVNETIFKIEKVESVQTTNSIETLDSLFVNPDLDSQTNYVSSPLLSDCSIKSTENNKIFDFNDNYLNTQDDSEIIDNPKQIILMAKKFSHNENKNPNIKINFPIDTNTFYTTDNDFVILSNLTLLAKIKPNMKLTINPINNKLSNCQITFELGVENSYLPVISRWYKKQGRHETIDALNKLIDVGIEQYKYYVKTNNVINSTKYIKLLESSTTGLNNLKITYSQDKNIVLQLDKIIEKIIF